MDYEKPRCKNKRITVHQSGRVNFHENGRSIFLEPLTDTTITTCIYGYRIPAINKLDEFCAPINSEDSIFNLSELGNGAVSFSFSIAPANLGLSGKAIKIAYATEGYALSISVDKQPFPVPIGYEEYFTTLSPTCGPFAMQKISEEQALISYHQALVGSTNCILYPPNGEGDFKLIFSVPMRVAPRFKIELADPGLHVIDQDVHRESRSERVMLKFKIRDEKTKQIIKEPVAFRSIELDAEL